MEMMENGFRYSFLPREEIYGYLNELGRVWEGPRPQDRGGEESS